MKAEVTSGSVASCLYTVRTSSGGEVVGGVGAAEAADMAAEGK